MKGYLEVCCTNDSQGYYALRYSSKNLDKVLIGYEVIDFLCEVLDLESVTGSKTGNLATVIEIESAFAGDTNLSHPFKQE